MVSILPSAWITVLVPLPFGTIIDWLPPGTRPDGGLAEMRSWTVAAQAAVSVNLVDLRRVAWNYHGMDSVMVNPNHEFSSGAFRLTH